MTAKPPERSSYRYTVLTTSENLTPLAAVKAFMGPQEVQVLNLSQGGVALLASEDFKTEIGNPHDISLSIQEREFPVRIEIKAVRGRILHCMFLEPPRAFQAFLRTFLQPKYLGTKLRPSEALTNRPDALALVAEAEQHFVYTGENQLGFFVWTRLNRGVLKIVGMSRDLVIEWTPREGLRTGRLATASQDDIVWDRNPEMAVLHYFNDILLAWLPMGVGSGFVERLMSDPGLVEGEEALYFPEI